MSKITMTSAAIATAAAMFVTTVPASADSWTRNWSGPNGAHGTRAVTCGYHACGYTAQGTGPNGNSWSRSGRVVHGPYRSYGYHTVTGPQGNTYVTRRVWRRY